MGEITLIVGLAKKVILVDKDDDMGVGAGHAGDCGGVLGKDRFVFRGINFQGLSGGGLGGRVEGNVLIAEGSFLLEGFLGCVDTKSNNKPNGES